MYRPWMGEDAYECSLEEEGEEPEYFEEDWDNLDAGFDPYMGCYSDDC